jgi:hypothetical protein
MAGRHRSIASVLALGALAAFAPGCGGGSDFKRAAPPPPPAPTRAADAEVIRAWADQLRTGHIDAATKLFAVPATVQNGTPPIVLDSTESVQGFNSSLPCGARLLRTLRRGRYTVGVFRLTGRPGGDCGSGTGFEAATAFLIRGGKILEWRRVDVPKGGTPVPSRPPRDTPSQSL